MTRIVLLLVQYTKLSNEKINVKIKAWIMRIILPKKYLLNRSESNLLKIHNVIIS